MTNKKKNKKYKVISAILYGIIESIIIIILYIYILPQLISNIYTQLNIQQQIPLRSNIYLLVLGTILGLGVASRALKGTIFRPILASSANLIGLLYAFSFFGNGVLEANGLPAGDFKISFSLDISPLILIFFAFFGVSSVIMPFIEYFYSQNNK